MFVIFLNGLNFLLKILKIVLHTMEIRNADQPLENQVQHFYQWPKQSKVNPDLLIIKIFYCSPKEECFACKQVGKKYGRKNVSFQKFYEFLKIISIQNPELIAIIIHHLENACLPDSKLWPTLKEKKPFPIQDYFHYLLAILLYHHLSPSLSVMQLIESIRSVFVQMGKTLDNCYVHKWYINTILKEALQEIEKRDYDMISFISFINNILVLFSEEKNLTLKGVLVKFLEHEKKSSNNDTNPIYIINNKSFYYFIFKLFF